jgi:hypothetical protein
MPKSSAVVLRQPLSSTIRAIRLPASVGRKVCSKFVFHFDGARDELAQLRRRQIVQSKQVDSRGLQGRFAILFRYGLRGCFPATWFDSIDPNRTSRCFDKNLASGDEVSW